MKTLKLEETKLKQDSNYQDTKSDKRTSEEKNRRQTWQMFPESEERGVIGHVTGSEDKPRLFLVQPG